MEVWIVLFTNPACATECAKIKAVVLDAIRPEAYRNVHFLEFSEEDYPIFMDELDIDQLPALGFFKEDTDVENLVLIQKPVQASNTDVNAVRSVLNSKFGITDDGPKKSNNWIWWLLLVLVIAAIWVKFKK